MTRLELEQKRKRRIKRIVAVSSFTVGAIIGAALMAGSTENGKGQESKAAAEPVPAKPAALTEEVQVIPLVPDYEAVHTDEDIVALAQMAYGEAWGTQSDTHMSACMWSVLNRYDSGDPYYADCDSIYDIVVQRGQYHGYRENNPVEDRLTALAEDVLTRWYLEKAGAKDVGRTLPAEFTFFYGDGRVNHYTTEYGGGVEYDWYLGTPYEN